jgi:leader peptidase (prepilin peptidase) / N-methyltransferase
MLPLLLYALVGFLAGIVVNRAADNLPPPARRSLLEAPRCRYCGMPREWWEQSGLLSFLSLHGHCHHCHAPLPLRAPVVELLTAVLFGYLWSRFGPGQFVLTYSFFTAILLLITIIDLEHRLILNVVVLPATLLALFVRPLDLLLRAPMPTLLDWLYGLVLGYAVVFGIYLLGNFLARLVGRARGSPLDEVAFGLGDVKLAGLVGGLVGFPTILFTLFYTILLGGLVGLGVILFQLLVRRRYAAFMAIPYGPFFTITTWLFLMHWV